MSSLDLMLTITELTAERDRERAARESAEARADELQAKYDKDVRSAMGAAERFRAQGLKDKARADELQREREAAREREAFAKESEAHWIRQAGQARREADQLRAALRDARSMLWPDMVEVTGPKNQADLWKRIEDLTGPAALAGVQADNKDSA